METSCYAVNKYNDNGVSTIEDIDSTEKLSLGEFVNVSSIIEYFLKEVTNKIMNGAIHSGYNIKSPYTGIPVVPPEYLGSKNLIPTPNIGSQNSRVNATTIYTSLVSVTRYLLRVGTYTYTEEMTVTGSWPYGAPSSNKWISEGKALFSDQYTADKISGGDVNELINASITPPIDQSPVLETKIINATELQDLIKRCYLSWETSNRPNYVNNHIYCHNSCHNNCHKSCHKDRWDYISDNHEDSNCYRNGSCHAWFQ